MNQPMTKLLLGNLKRNMFVTWKSNSDSRFKDKGFVSAANIRGFEQDP